MRLRENYSPRALHPRAASASRYSSATWEVFPSFSECVSSSPISPLESPKSVTLMIKVKLKKPNQTKSQRKSLHRWHGTSSTLLSAVKVLLPSFSFHLRHINSHANVIHAKESDNPVSSLILFVLWYVSWKRMRASYRFWGGKYSDLDHFLISFSKIINGQ